MEWIRGRIIGRGSSAAVSLATSVGSGEIFAVKSADFSKSDFLQRESEILSSLSSPYVVGYRGCEITKEPSGTEPTYNLLMEYAPNGTLADLVRRRQRLDEPEIAYYARQILLGLDYLHSNRVAHCDIKGSNILLTEKGVAKLADFGCSKRIGDSTIGGTPAFMAPEVARGEKQGFESDIWALGCTVIEMATGLPPWVNTKPSEPSDPVRVLYRVGFSGESPEVPRSLSDQPKDFLEKCLRRNPEERWTASQLLNHPFIVNFNGSDFENLNAKLISPTSVIDQRFWYTVESGESDTLENLVRPLSCHGSIGRLGLISGGPSWDWDDESWVTVREGNDPFLDDVEGFCGLDVRERFVQKDYTCSLNEG